jgi:hypothetical protein
MTELIADEAQEALPPGHPANKKRKSRAWHVAQILLAVAVVIACFFYAISSSRPR